MIFVFLCLTSLSMFISRSIQGMDLVFNRASFELTAVSTIH